MPPNKELRFLHKALLALGAILLFGAIAGQLVASKNTIAFFSTSLAAWATAPLGAWLGWTLGSLLQLSKGALDQQKKWRFRSLPSVALMLIFASLPPACLLALVDILTNRFGIETRETVQVVYLHDNQKFDKCRYTVKILSGSFPGERQICVGKKSFETISENQEYIVSAKSGLLGFAIVDFEPRITDQK